MRSLPIPPSAPATTGTHKIWLIAARSENVMAAHSVPWGWRRRMHGSPRRSRAPCRRSRCCPQSPVASASVRHAQPACEKRSRHTSSRPLGCVPGPRRCRRAVRRSSRPTQLAAGDPRSARAPVLTMWTGRPRAATMLPGAEAMPISFWLNISARGTINSGHFTLLPRFPSPWRRQRPTVPGGTVASPSPAV
jgi:hypothetical protein